MSSVKQSRKAFRTRWFHRQPRYWLASFPDPVEGARRRPEIITLPAEGGDGLPPVRIFLGTERMQARAERVFVYSVVRARDPRREYQIHLMKDLADFPREGWTTGFSNYRFAIPTMAGGHGRAIYNDVDQIYLDDPAAIFDMEMNGSAILSVEMNETSVSVLDAERLAPFWNAAQVRSRLKRKDFIGMLEKERLWGPLPSDWNVRDVETSDDPKCLHYTTLGMQPWRPFPARYRYRDHPNGDAWFAMEREADARRFTSFTRERPSSGFDAGGYEGLDETGPDFAHASRVDALIERHKATRIFADGATPQLQAGRCEIVTPTSRRYLAPPQGGFDGVVSIGALSRLPEDDAPWVLDELFGAARSFVYAAVACDAPKADNAGAAPAEWWRLQFELAARRAPGVVWRLLTFGGRKPLSFGSA